MVTAAAAAGTSLGAREALPSRVSLSDFGSPGTLNVLCELPGERRETRFLRNVIRATVDTQRLRCFRLGTPLIPWPIFNCNCQFQADNDQLVIPVP